MSTLGHQGPVVLLATFDGAAAPEALASQINPVLESHARWLDQGDEGMAVPEESPLGALARHEGLPYLEEALLCEAYEDPPQATVVGDRLFFYGSYASALPPCVEALVERRGGRIDVRASEQDVLVFVHEVRAASRRAEEPLLDGFLADDGPIFAHVAPVFAASWRLAREGSHSVLRVAAAWNDPASAVPNFAEHAARFGATHRFDLLASPAPLDPAGCFRPCSPPHPLHDLEIVDPGADRRRVVDLLWNTLTYRPGYAAHPMAESLLERTPVRVAYAQPRVRLEPVAAQLTDAGATVRLEAHDPAAPVRMSLAPMNALSWDGEGT